jgi:hypothetical protein
VLASCLELEQRVTIRSDGSGTQTLKLGMTESALQAARRQAAIAAEDAAATPDPERIFDVRLVRAEVAAAGMVCKDVRVTTARRRRIVEVDAEFASLEQLQRSPLDGGEAEWELAAGPKPGTVRLAFYPRGGAAHRVAVEKAKRLGEKPTAIEQHYFERAKSEMQGLALRWVLELPGDVLACSANVDKTGARQITATVAAQDLTSPSALILQLAPRFEVVFDARACTFKLP